MKKLCIYWLSICLIVMTCFQSSYGQGLADKQAKSGLSLKYFWTTLPWEKGSNVFSRSRIEIERMPLSKIKNEFFGTERWFEQKPTPLQFFRYATAAFVGTTIFHDPTARFHLARATRLIDKIPSQPNSDYARIHFLLISFWDADFNLKDIGFRLCKLDKKDYFVRFYLCTSLKPDIRPDYKLIALRLCDEMQNILPLHPSVYSTRGSIYFRCWLMDKKKEDRIKGIESYREFLKESTPLDEFRPRAKYLIQLMSQGKK